MKDDPHRMLPILLKIVREVVYHGEWWEDWGELKGPGRCLLCLDGRRVRAYDARGKVLDITPTGSGLHVTSSFRKGRLRELLRVFELRRKVAARDPDDVLLLTSAAVHSACNRDALPTSPTPFERTVEASLCHRFVEVRVDGDLVFQTRLARVGEIALELYAIGEPKTLLASVPIGVLPTVLEPGPWEELLLRRL